MLPGRRNSTLWPFDPPRTPKSAVAGFRGPGGCGGVLRAGRGGGGHFARGGRRGGGGGGPPPGERGSPEAEVCHGGPPRQHEKVYERPFAFRQGSPRMRRALARKTLSRKPEGYASASQSRKSRRWA